jgi:hypothetical protein
LFTSLAFAAADLHRDFFVRPLSQPPKNFFSAVSLISINPAGFHDHPARDALTLASGRLSFLLAL